MIARNRIIGSRIVERAHIDGAPAAIIQFPILARRAFIVTIARAMMRKRSAAAADECVGKALRRLMNEMRRQGIPAATIRREVYAMEALLRGAAWRIMFPWIETEKISGRRRRREIHNRRRSDASANRLVFSWIGDGQ
jgi:hypothetical protein